MSQEEQVRAALKALADHDRNLESRLPAPRMPRVGSPWKARAAYSVAALAAAAAVVVVVRPAPPEPAPAPVVETPAPVIEQVVPAVEEKPKPARRVVREAAPVLAAAPVETPEEIATEFFPLTEAPMPFERGQLVRVVVPAMTMQRVGLPVRPERWSDGVTADLLVGDEGMARAIRFVSFEQ